MSGSPPYAPADILASGDFQEGIRWLVLRGPFESPCAYIGIPASSPAAGLNADFLDATGPAVHGGWTFSGAGDGHHRPEDWWWWGWDYAHGGDWIDVPRSLPVAVGGYRWTVDEVVAQVRSVLPEFEAWLRSGPEERAPADARKLPPTMAELRTMAEELFGQGCLDVR